MRLELEAAGYEVVMAGDASLGPATGGRLPRPFDAVIVGLDPQVDYGRIAAAMSAVEHGARLVATNADARYPTAEGFLPGAGSIVAALATATGVPPEVIGKPEPAMFTAILEESGIDAASAVVIGDNPDADVVGAHRAGIASLLVLTGVATAAAAAGLDGERRPTMVVADPAAVRGVLERRISS
jgi:HAD superfamily hydrolase (TIGR01450 family)